MSQSSIHNARYPLGQSQVDELLAASGRQLSQIDLETATTNQLSAADLSISAQTLRAQAAIARDGGYPQLATNLERAAELTAVPNALLLEMYELLRPRRATYAGLLAMADRLDDEYSAPITAAFVREAAEAYRMRGILRPE